MPLDADHYTTIAIEKRPNGVAIATLNRPERLNAVNGHMHNELSMLTRDADDDHDVKVLVHHRRRPGVLRRWRLQLAAPTRPPSDQPGMRRGPDRGPPARVRKPDHLRGQRLRHGPRRHGGPAVRRRGGGTRRRLRRHARQDRDRRRRRRPGHLAVPHGRQPGQVLPDDRRPAPRRGGRAARPGELRRRGRRADDRGPRHRRPPGEGAGAGHRGVQGADQPLAAVPCRRRCCRCR